MATIDWRLGKLRKVVGPIPFVDQWAMIEDTIVATTWDNRFICLSP